MEGYSGAEIGAVCREAAMKAMEDFEFTGSLIGISRTNLEDALREVKPRTSPESIKYFECFSQNRK